MAKNADSNAPVNQLICFADADTGIKLCQLSVKLISRTKASTMTMLQLMTEEQAHLIGDIEKYKNNTFQSTIELCKSREITIRIFVKISDNFSDDIVTTVDEYGCNLLLVGIDKQTIDDNMVRQHNPFVNGNENQFFFNRQNATESITRKSDVFDRLSSLINRVTIMAGIFINNELRKIENIFIPLLDINDTPLFRFVNSFSLKDIASVITWDAVGIIENNPDLKKAYRDKFRSSDERFRLWDTNEKISCDFIKQQDLIIIGLESWNKLTSAALSWSHSLPSTLIIKDKTN